MSAAESNKAREIARAITTFQQQTTGHAPGLVSVVVSGETLVVTLREALSPAEKTLAQSPAGAAKVREYHQQLFANSCDALRAEIKRITGVNVHDAAASVGVSAGSAQVFSNGTMVQVFLLDGKLPTEAWHSQG